MVAPFGLEGIEKVYGDPHDYMREDGTVSPLWERRMVSVHFPHPIPLGWMVRGETMTVTRCRVNEAIAGEVASLFRAWLKAKLWDDIRTFDGAYCWRPMRGSSKLSMHAYGGAIDFNAATNRLGTKGDISPRLVEIAQGRGWTWGGEWKRPDPMHFQMGVGY